MSERKSLDQQLMDGLRRFQNDFDRDFSFKDIQPEMQRILSKNVYLQIIQSATEVEKIEILFFHFIYVLRDVSKLLHSIKSSYPWLFDKIYNSTGDKWISDYNKAIQDVPNNEDWNIHRTKYLWEIQKNLKKLKRNEYLILFGKSGFGKRWLAA